MSYSVGREQPPVRVVLNAAAAGSCKSQQQGCFSISGGEFNKENKYDMRRKMISTIQILVKEMLHTETKKIFFYYKIDARQLQLLLH